MNDANSFASVTESSAESSTDSLLSDHKSTDSSDCHSFCIDVSVRSDQSYSSAIEDDIEAHAAEAPLSNGRTTWEDLTWEESLSEKELRCKVFDLLSSTLKTCVDKGGSRLKIIDDQLRLYVQHIADLYNNDNNNIYHNFHHAVQVFVRADFL